MTKLIFSLIVIFLIIQPIKNWLEKKENKKYGDKN